MDRREALLKTAYLMGSALSPSAISGILTGCTAAPTSDWLPKFFTPDQAGVVGALIDRILPATDTPGALELGVDSFIDSMLDQVYSEKDQNRFLGGLSIVNKYSQELHRNTFIDCGPEDQDLVISKIQEEAIGLRQTESEQKPADQHFFFMLKELTLLGYFTSERVMKEQFSYRPVPDQWNPCAPWMENEKVWMGAQIGTKKLKDEG